MILDPKTNAATHGQSAQEQLLGNFKQLTLPLHEDLSIEPVLQYNQDIIELRDRVFGKNKIPGKDEEALVKCLIDGLSKQRKGAQQQLLPFAKHLQNTVRGLAPKTLDDYMEKVVRKYLDSQHSKNEATRAGFIKPNMSQGANKRRQHELNAIENTRSDKYKRAKQAHTGNKKTCRACNRPSHSFTECELKNTTLM